MDKNKVVPGRWYLKKDGDVVVSCSDINTKSFVGFQLSNKSKEDYLERAFQKKENIVPFTGHISIDNGVASIVGSVSDIIREDVFKDQFLHKDCIRIFGYEFGVYCVDGWLWYHMPLFEEFCSYDDPDESFEEMETREGAIDELYIRFCKFVDNLNMDLWLSLSK